eukprot:COSAG06_NODE_6980_length_2689_cov_1.555598_1_plen_50_part_00
MPPQNGKSCRAVLTGRSERQRGVSRISVSCFRIIRIREVLPREKLASLQ